MPSTYSTGYHKTGFHFEQLSTGKIKQRLVSSSGSMIEVGAGGMIRNLNLESGTTAGITQHATLNPDGLTVLATSGVYKLNPYRGSHAVIVSYNTQKSFIKGDPAIDAVHFSLWTSTKNSTDPHVISVKCSSQQNKTMGSWLDIYGLSTHYAVTRLTYSTHADLGDAYSSSTGS